MTEFIIAHWLDITTTILGLLYIWFEYRASAWLWAVGFLMQTLGIVLYYQKGLYADCGMEFYYLSMTIYGYWKWVRGAANQQALPITRFPRKLIIPWCALILAVWGIIYWLLITFTNSNVPLIDSFTTALSIVGIWAFVDVVTCGLYFYKDIPFKGGLYALYIIIAVFGYRKWKQMIDNRSI